MPPEPPDVPEASCEFIYDAQSKSFQTLERQLKSTRQLLTNIAIWTGTPEVESFWNAVQSQPASRWLEFEIANYREMFPTRADRESLGDLRWRYIERSARRLVDELEVASVEWGSIHLVVAAVGTSASAAIRYILSPLVDLWTKIDDARTQAESNKLLRLTSRAKLGLLERTIALQAPLLDQLENIGDVDEYTKLNEKLLRLNQAITNAIEPIDSLGLSIKPDLRQAVEPPSLEELPPDSPRIAIEQRPPELPPPGLSFD